MIEMLAEITIDMMTDEAETDLMREVEAIGTEMMTDRRVTITTHREKVGETDLTRDQEKTSEEAEVEKRMQRNSLRWADRPQKREEI
jgi:hypothetical protein